MHPIIFKFKLPSFLGNTSITIYSYALLIVMGAVIATILIKHLAKKQLHYTVPYTFFYKAFIAGFVGGKLFCFLESPMLYIQNKQAATQLLKSGFVCYGSVLFIAGFTAYHAAKKKISVFGFLDIIAISCVVPQILGRLGCFFAGCCYGKPTNSSLGVLFPNVTNTPVHATQLYEVSLTILVFSALLYINKYKKQNGQAILFYSAAYATIRFLLEFTRGDSRGFLFDGLLSHSQIISILILLFIVFILFYNKTKILKQT